MELSCSGWMLKISYQIDTETLIFFKLYFMPKEKTVHPDDFLSAKVKKVRTPRNLESITAGALALSLTDRVELCKRIKESVSMEVALKQKESEEAKQIANGL